MFTDHNAPLSRFSDAKINIIGSSEQAIMESLKPKEYLIRIFALRDLILTLAF